MCHIPIPSPEEMEMLSQSERLKHLTILAKKAGYRVSKDGKVTFLTEEECEKLWSDSSKNSE